LPRRIFGAFCDVRAVGRGSCSLLWAAFAPSIGMPDGPAGQTDTRSRRWANGKLAFGRQTVMWEKLSDA